MIFRKLHITHLWIPYIVIAIILPPCAIAQKINTEDSITTKNNLRFPLKDRRSDPFAENRINNPFQLLDTAFIKREVAYHSKTKQYYITEKIGNSYYRKPTALSDKEFMQLMGSEQERNYFKFRICSILISIY